MARYLPLFPGDQRSTVERTQALVTSDGHGACRRCKLSRNATSVCIEPEVAELGNSGATVLLVGEMPGMHEDRTDRPFAGKSGALLRTEVAKHWQGRVVFDNALKCIAPRMDREKKQTVEYVDACRGYLAETIELAKPERVIALGSVAVMALLGRSVPPYSVRRGYGFFGDGTPVFLGINPAAALRNRFVLNWFKQDLQHALTTDLPVPTQWDAEFTIVETREDAERAVASLLASPWFSFDVETSGVFGDPYFRMLAFAACPSGTDNAFVWTEAALNDPLISGPLFRALEDPSVRKVGHNVKYDVVSMWFAHGVRVRGVHFDTMLDRRALKADSMARLEYVAELVGMGGHKREMTSALAGACGTIGLARAKRAKLSKTGTKQVLFLPGLEDPAIEAACRLPDVDAKAFALALVEPKTTIYRYVARDAVATTRSGEHLRPLLARRGVEPVSSIMLAPAVEAYARVEEWGMPFSARNCRRFNEFLTAQKTKVDARLSNYGIKGFDPSSRDQVEHMLFDVLKLKSKERDRTKSKKRGTGKKILKHLIDAHPFVRDLLEFRRLEKLLGTYAEGLMIYVREDGRIHPNVKITGTETGRPSCEDPNLQNLPRAQTTEGAMARDCFVTEPGLVLVEADYSQIEIRVAAMLSGDRKMLDAYTRGEDLHWRTTRVLSKDAWGLAADAVTEKERSESKAVTFGLMYGKQDATLAEELGISIEKAATIRRLVLGEYNGFSDWCDEQQSIGARTGETWTYWNGERFRVRPIWQIGDALDEGRPTQRATTARNSCINTPIQGTASDYCLRSLIAVVAACAEGRIKAKVIITIHDSIMLECRREDADLVAAQVGEIMRSWPTMAGMPLVVDFKIGRSWGSMKGFHPYHEEKSASHVLAAMGY